MSINTLSTVPEEQYDELPEWFEISENQCPACDKERQGENTTFSEHVSDPNGCLYINPCLGCWLQLPMDHTSHQRYDGYPGGCIIPQE